MDPEKQRLADDLKIAQENAKKTEFSLVNLIFLIDFFIILNISLLIVFLEWNKKTGDGKRRI